jgi:uncharacterized protein YjbJ (UPF0337 family)
VDEKLDHMKGKVKVKVKEKAGWLADDRELEREGKRDQVKSDVKKTIDDAGDAVKRGVDQVSDSARATE